MRYAHLSPDVPRDAVKLLDGLGSRDRRRVRSLGDRLGNKRHFGT